MGPAAAGEDVVVSERPARRALTPTERVLLEALIELAPHSRAALREQAKTAEVVGTCACGCGTFTLAVASTTPPAAPAPNPFADVAVAEPAPARDVLLFLDKGRRLTMVEVVPYDADGERPLPHAAQLRPRSG